MKWSILGHRPKTPAPSWPALILAFFYASQTFIDSSDGYPIYMAFLAIASSIWFGFQGLKSGSLLAALLPAIGASWFSPLFGWNDFSQMDVFTFLAHSLLAILFGVAAYTFAATEKKVK